MNFHNSAFVFHTVKKDWYYQPNHKANDRNSSQKEEEIQMTKL